jgi:hypothetical protein
MTEFQPRSAYSSFGRSLFCNDQGDYTVSTQYDPDLDPRPVAAIRVDALDRTFIIDNYRVAINDPTDIWTDLVSKYGFTAVDSTQMTVTGQPTDGRIQFKLKVPISYLKVNLQHYVRRSFEIHIADEPWRSGEIVSPASLNGAASATHTSATHLPISVRPRKHRCFVLRQLASMGDHCHSAHFPSHAAD